MKQKTKKIITLGGTILLGLSLIGNVVLGINLANKSDSESLSGSINESWQVNDANIVYNVLSHNKYYSAAGDYIYYVRFHFTNAGYYLVSYEAEFSWRDDLESYFVFSNSNNQVVYVSDKEKTHTKNGGDDVKISTSIVDQYDLKNCHISEVWVRTID